MPDPNSVLLSVPHMDFLFDEIQNVPVFPVLLFSQKVACPLFFVDLQSNGGETVPHISLISHCRAR
jgi:hypothetical protein